MIELLHLGPDLQMRLGVWAGDIQKVLYAHTGCYSFLRRHPIVYRSGSKKACDGCCCHAMTHSEAAVLTAWDKTGPR